MAYVSHNSVRLNSALCVFVCVCVCVCVTSAFRYRAQIGDKVTLNGYQEDRLMIYRAVYEAFTNTLTSSSHL